MTVWLAVAGAGLATWALKAAGPVLLAGRQLPLRVDGVVSLIAPVLLTALVVVQAVGGDEEIVLDERLAGLAAAGVAYALRAPLIVAMAAAAGVTALLRAFA